MDESRVPDPLPGGALEPPRRRPPTAVECSLRRRLTADAATLLRTKAACVSASPRRLSVSPPFRLVPSSPVRPPAYSEWCSAPHSRSAVRRCWHSHCGPCRALIRSRVATSARSGEPLSASFHARPS